MFDQERAQINALMEHTTDNIYFKDTKSRFVRINKAMANYFQINDPTLVIGKTDFDFFTEEHARQAFDDEKAILQTGQSIRKEEKETWGDKPDTWVSTVKMPWYDDNKNMIGIFGISRDITDRVLANLALKEKNEEIEVQNEELMRINEELLEARLKAEESDKLKTAILQNMNHEIRTPLNGILGFAELLPLVTDKKNKLEDYCRIIIQNSYDLLNVINNLIDIARIETGQMRLNPIKSNLDRLFNEIISYFKEYQLRNKKQDIQLILKGNCNLSGFSIFADENKLKQILMNLIANAFKFTKKGSIQIEYNLVEDKELIISVSDTGIGITPDKQKYIFEHFTQINNENSRISGGTGVGLAIVKSLVELMKGRVWLKSELNLGSTFFISIPLDQGITGRA